MSNISESSPTRKPPSLTAPVNPPNLTDKIIKPEDQYWEAGSFGDVYKCRCNSESSTLEVAVKAFRFKFTLAEEDETEGNQSAKMIRRELGIWKRLRHKNIVPFLGIAYGFGRRESASLVSLWMPNGTLHHLLGEHDDKLTVFHRLHLLSGVANGLQYLHSFPIVHGDLSANNVLLDDDYNALLTDFGFASLVGSTPEGMTYLHTSAARPGTLRWAAPEHFSTTGSQRTTKSDIYSFGNLSLQVLSGKQPWSEVPQDVSVLLRLSKGETPARPESRPIDDPHWELIQDCWSQLNDRPPATDLVSRIEQFLHSCQDREPLCTLFVSQVTSPHTDTGPSDLELPAGDPDRAIEDTVRVDTSSSSRLDTRNSAIPDTSTSTQNRADATDIISGAGVAEVLTTIPSGILPPIPSLSTHTGNHAVGIFESVTEQHDARQRFIDTIHSEVSLPVDPQPQSSSKRSRSSLNVPLPSISRKRYIGRLTDWWSKTTKRKDILSSTQARAENSTSPPILTNPGSGQGVVTTQQLDQSSRSSVAAVSTTSYHVQNEDDAEIRSSEARKRFINAIRSVIMLQRNTRPMSPRINSPFDTPVAPGSGISPGRFPDTGMPLRGVRVTTAIDKLKALEPMQEMDPHKALVRHLQFSPNGRYLATSSWDRTAVIFRVGESFTTHRILVHVRGFIGQVAWSPNGRILLTRLTRGIKVWSEDGVCKKTIERQNTVQSITWLPTGDAFLAVEGSDVVKIDLHGRVLDTYYLGQVRLINVAITPDCSRLVGVGPSITPPSVPQPSRHTRVEKRIVVYNMITRRKESQTPFAHDVCDIAMARKTPSVLISPEKTAPELWKLEIIRDRDRAEYAQTSRLSLKHTFVPERPVDIVGPAQFGGKDDQFVLCAGKAGDIHIWDREMASLLRYIRGTNVPGDGVLTSLAWNYATDDPMMFATGSHDGTVRIYSNQTVDDEDDESYLERQTEGDRAMNYSVHSGG